jgi:hypothetical protein
MSELLLYFSHNLDSDFINSLLKSTYLEQIKHFIFLSLFLKMLLPFSWALLSTPMLLLVVAAAAAAAGLPFFSPETLAASAAAAAALPEDIPFGSSKDWELEGDDKLCGINKES